VTFGAPSVPTFDGVTIRSAWPLLSWGIQCPYHSSSILALDHPPWACSHLGFDPAAMWRLA
jgi:hypothetical protein